MLFRHLKGAGQPHIPFPEALVRMNMKLSKEMETLFIPLYGKASLSKQGLFKDPYAEAVVSQLDYDWSSLKIPRKTQVMLALRAFLMDEYTKDYIASSPI